MGGNVTAINKNTFQTYRAERINLKQMNRSVFKQDTSLLFKKLNSLYKKKYKENLWNNNYIEDGSVFNGSSSYIMGSEISDAEIEQFKPFAGDIDIAVPVESKQNLWHLLDTLEGTYITDNIFYAGSNKPTLSGIGARINCIFIYNKTNVQVDFEFLPFDGDKPTEWSKFAHSSTFSDTKIGIKAVSHKYLIRSLVGGASQRFDAVVATKRSTPSNITLSKSVINTNPRMIKFSVDNGIRFAYEPLLDEDGNKIFIEGKEVLKELKTSFVTDVKEIFKMSFKRDSVTDEDIDMFNSFVGVVDLCKKYLTTEESERTHKRFVEILWGNGYDRAQELVVGDPDADLEIKKNGYMYFIEKLGFTDISKDYIISYYKEYGKRKSKDNYSV